MKRNCRWFRLAVLMILLLIFGAVLPGNVYAAEVNNEKAVKEEKNEKDEKDKEESYSAKVIRLLHYEGEVGIEDAEGKSAFMMENIRLSSGQALVTGPESSASVGLDDSRILSLDADTRVEFIQEKDQLELNLVKGTLFLDVQDKLDENEILDIRTSTMAVGIRGTIVFVSVGEGEAGVPGSEQKVETPGLEKKDISQAQSGNVTEGGPEGNSGITTVGVLEGTARINSLDENGQDVYSVISAGQKATIPSNGEAAPSVRVASSGEEISQEQKLQKTGSPAETSKMELPDLPEFVKKMIDSDEEIRKRVEEASAVLTDTPADQDYLYAAGGYWTWTDQVTLVARSASKMYDGTPLTCETDVLVYGLPNVFSIKTSAGGSQTEAGQSSNPVAAYNIFNSRGEDVTSHFKNIKTVDGQLVVDPAPITIWTGSAEKVYDGTPLTAKEASVRFVEGYKKEQSAWTNRSYLVTEPVGSAYNKQILYGLSGITKVHASDPYSQEIGEVVLAAGERLTICPSAPKGEDSSPAEQESGGTSSGSAAKETGAGASTGGEGVKVSSGASGENDSINGLSSFEFRIEKINEEDLPREILQIYADNPELLAQVCQETDWDPEVMADLIAALPESEEKEKVTMDALQVGKAEAERLMTELTNIRLTVDSDITKYYNKPLGTLEAHFTPVRIDDDIKVKATGSQTDVGESVNTYEIDWGNADPANYVVNEDPGTLKVTPAPLSVTTESAEKSYDGAPLTQAQAELSGLVNGESASVTGTGTITRVGSIPNTYSIDWGTAKEGNYEIIEENLGTLKVTPAGKTLTITTGSASKTYDGSPLVSSDVTVSGLIKGDSVTVTPTGSITDAGSVKNTYTIDWGNTDPDNYNIEENLGTLTVRPADLTISTGSAEKPYDGSALKSSSFEISGLQGTDSVTVTPTGSITNAGSEENTYAIDWGDTNPDNYNIEENLGTLTVKPADLTISTGSAEKIYDGEPLTSSKVTVSGLADGETITVTPTGSIINAGTAKNTCTINWGHTKSSNYDLTQNLGTLTVNHASIKLTITTGSDEKTYDGSALTNSEASVTGLVGDDSVTVTATGTITDAGTAQNTYTISWTGADKDNYELTEELGTLTVNKAPLTVRTGSAKKDYDGKALTSSKVNIEGLAGGETITVTPTGTVTDAGTAENTCTIDWSGAKEDNYTLKKEPGTLTVNKAALTVKTGSAEKDYDGTALTSSDVDIDGLAEGETITVTPTGSITQAGTAKNNCTIDWGSAKESNYTLTTEPGTLTVNHASIKLTITTGSDSKTYDGSALTDNEASVTGLVGDDSVTVTATGTITDAGTAQNGYTIDWGGTDPENYKVVETLGTLTVNKAPLTIRTGSAEKVYDGSALKSSEVSVDGLAAGETVTLTADGSITDAGETDNTYTIDWGSAKESNYTLSEQMGKLKVKPMPVTFDLKAPETLYSTYAWVPDGLTASWPGKDDVPAEEENKAYGMYELAFLDAVFALPQGKVTMKIPAVSGEGEHKLSPALTFTKGKESNYEISCINDTVKMETVELTIDMNCTDSVYNGGYYIPEGLTARYSDETVVEAVEELILDDSERPVGVEASFHIKTGTLTLRINGVKDAGTYTVEPYQKALTGVSVSFGYTNNTMAIKPAPLTVETGSAEKAYDGTALTSSKVTVTGLQGDDTVTATATGSIKDVGETKNSYTIDWDGAKESNYTVTEELGTLKVTRASKLLTIRTGSSTRPYNGKPLENGEVTVEGLIGGDSVSVTAAGSITDAGSAQNTYTIDWGTTDKNNYVLEEELGTLTVSKAPLTITTGSAEKIYDGEALTSSEVTVDGLADGETITVTPTGTITDAGTEENTCTINWGTAKSSNYDLTKNLGTLKVTHASKKLIIRTGSSSRPYNGSPLTNSEAAVDGLIDGDSVTVTATGTITDAGSAENTYTISWTGADKDNYELEEELGTLTVDKAALTITTGSAEKIYDGTALTSSEVDIDGLAAGETITVTPTGTITQVGSAENTCTITWGTAKESNYALTTKPGTLKVTNAKAKLTITTPSSSKTYDGTPLAGGEATVTGLIAGDSVTVTSTGTITDAGTARNGYTIDWGGTDPENYTVVENLGTLTVDPAKLKISTGSETKNYDGTALTDSEVSITGLVEGESVTVTATGSITDAGSAENACTIDWSGAKEENYTLTKELGTLTVNKAPLTVSTGSAEKTYDGTALTNSEVDIEGLAAGETITVTTTGTITQAGSVKNSCSIAWGTAKKSNYDLTTELGTLTVNNAAAVLTINTGSAEKTYDGKALTSSVAAVYGLIGSDSVTVTTTGTITDAGTAQNTYTIDWGDTDKDNYTVEANLGTLTVNPKDLTVSTGSAEKTYDGTALTDSEVNISGLVEGETVTVTATGSIKDVGSEENACTIAWSGAKEENYTLTKELGTLTVNKAALTVRTGSAEKTYDGEALTSSKVTITGLAAGETITVTPTGTITQAGTEENSCTITWGTAKKSNYDLTTELGTLTVNNAAAKLTITTPSSSKTYDGTPLARGEATVSGLIGGDSVTVTSTGTITDAGTAQNGYSIDWGETDSNNYTIVEKLGTLTVNKAPLTITTGSATKIYDGTALTSSEVDIEGLAAGETITVTTTGSITQAGSEENTCSIVWGTAKESNYDLEEKLGTLTVSNAEAVLIINTGSAEKTYDGKALTSTVAAVYGLIEGDSVTVTTTGTITDAGTAQNTYTIDWGDTDKDNYTVEATLGTLTVNPKDLTVSTGSAEKTYDGTALTDSEVNISGLVEGETVTVTAAGSIKDAGSAENTCSIAWGTAKEGNYNVTKEPGTLTVNKAPLTVKTGSASKIYDGTALTSSEVAITGLAAGETITVTPTGTITQVGSEENACTIAWGTAKESNYTLATELGTLTVTKAEAELTITTPSSSKTYDGTPLVGGEATVSGLIGGDTVTVTSTGTITDAGTAKNGYTIDWGETDSNNYTIVENLGTLTVNKAALTITTGSAEKTYDGTALTSSEANAAGLAAGESVTVTAAGSITDVGETKNTYTIEWGSTKEGNYALSEELGTLKVTPLPVSFDLKAPETLDSTSAWVPEGLTVSWTGTEPADAQEENKHSGVDDVPYLEAVFNLPGGKVTMTIPSVSGEGDHTLEHALDFTTGKASNYEITYVNDKVKMVKPELIVDMKCFEEVYFGGYLVPEGISAKYSDGTVAEAEEDYILEGERVIGTEVLFHLKEGTLVLRVNGVKDAGTYENIEPYETKLTGEEVDITYTNNTMIITPAPLTITTGSAEKVYDGEALTNSEVTIDGLADGETITVTPTGSITDQGEAENTYAIDWGSVKESNYTLSENLGKLEVTPLPVIFDLHAPETIYGTDAYVPAEVLTVSWPDSPDQHAERIEVYGEVTFEYLEADFVLPGGKVTMTVPAISGEGDYTLEHTLNFTEGKASNYEVEFVNDKVKMIKPELTIDMHCTDFITDYDGSYYMPEGISAEYGDGTAVDVEEDLIYEDERAVGTEAILHLKTGTLTLKIRGVKDAGTYTIEPYEAALTGEDVTLSYINNTIIINPVPLTITTGSDEKVYDGEALTNSEVNISGLVEGESVTVTAAGSITDAGETDNNYTINWGSVNADNYILNETLGKLKVTPIPVTFDLHTPGLFSVEPYVPYTITASWPGSGEESDPDDREYEYKVHMKAVFDLPAGGRVTLDIDPISEDGVHKIVPVLTMNAGNASNYEFSYVNNTVKLGTPDLTIDMGCGEVEYGPLYAPDKPDMTGVSEPLTEVTLEVSDYATYKEYTFKVFAESWYGEVTMKVNKVSEVGGHQMVPYGVVQTGEEMNINYLNDTLTIKPAPLTITTGSVEKVYDGTALTNSEVTASGDVLEQVDFSSVTITANGSITDVGEEDNTYTIDWGEEKEGNFTITDELGKLKVTPLPVTIDLNAPETLSTTDPWIPEGVTLSYGGSKYDPEEETVVGSPEEEEYYLKDVFALPGGKVTVETPAVSGEGTHTLKPKLTFASENKESNYDISYTNKTVKMGAAMSPLGFSASFMAKRPAAASSGMEMLTAGVRAITDTLSTEAAAMAGKETDQAGKAAASSAAAGKAASEGKEQAVQNDAAPDQTSEGEGFTDTDVLNADGEEKVQPQDPDPEEDQTAEEDGEEKKTPEPEVPGDRAPAQAEPVEEKEEKPSLPEKPADKEPAPTPAPAEPASAEPAEADSKQ